MKRKLLKFCLVMFVFVLFNKTLGLFVPDFYGDVELFNKFEHSKALDADVYLVGSSRTYRHIDPEFLNKELKDKNKIFYNLGTSGAFIPETFFICEQIFPFLADDNKTVVLELSYYRSIANGNSQATRSNYYWTFSSMLNYVSFCLNEKRFEDSFCAIKLWVNNQLGINTLKQKFQSLNSEYTIEGTGIDGFRKLQERSPKIRDSNDMNLLINNVKERKKGANNQNFNSILTKADKKMISAYQKIYEKAKEYNITLIAYLPPLTSYTREINTIYKNIAFDGKVDLSDSEKFPLFYEIENIYDKGHLNNKGAVIFTKEFGNLIKPML